MNLHRRSLISSFIAGCIALSCGTLLHGDSPPPSVLPGSIVTLEQAVSQAEIILIGQVKDMGLTNPDGPGNADFGDAKIETIKVLKGRASGTLTVAILIWGLEIGSHHVEKIPASGETYLFLIKSEGSFKRVIKMLPNDDASLKAVAEAMNAIPAKK